MGSNPTSSAEYMKQTNMAGLTTRVLLFLTLGFLMGFVLRSVLAGKQLDKRASYSNEFEIEQIQQGDEVRNMVLVKKVPYQSEVTVFPYKSGVRDTVELPVSSNIIMQFKGQVQITGNYFFDAPMGAVGPEGAVKIEDFNKVCMAELDEQSLNKIPRPISKDNDTWFCFDNSDYAFEQFGPVGSQGRASVVIDNYTINIFPSEVHDTATLIKVEK